MGGVRNGIPNLTALRTSRGVSLRQIADETRISTYYLQAIERGAIHKLPPGIYARSYVRQYARAIDYDEAELLRVFDLTPDLEEYEQPPPTPSRLNRLLHLLQPILNSRTEGSR
jgi:cytoskeletal protein RodZ